MKPIDILTNGKHSATIKEQKCTCCGKETPPESFRNSLSKKEYQISGFCQTCQDSVFGKD